MPSDSEVIDDIIILNKKQRIVFDFINKRSGDLTKNAKVKKQIDPIYLFLSGSGRTGKNRLIKTIYQAVFKTLVCHSKRPDKPTVLLLGSTDVAASNITSRKVASINW